MENLTRRNFIAATAVAVPAILGAQSKSGSKLPVIGEGEFMFEVQHDWGMNTLPASIKYGNTHSIAQDSNGLIYVHHTVHADSQSPDAVVVFDEKGKFVRSWGAMFRGGAHGMHIMKEGRTEYMYFCDEKHGIVTKRTLKGEEVWTMGYPQNSPTYQKGPGSTGPGGAAGLNYRPTNIAVHPTTLDFWIGDGYGSYYMFHYKQKTSTSYPELVRTFGGPPAAAAAPAGAGAAKGGDAQAKGGGQGKGKGGPAPADGKALAPLPADAQAKGGAAKGGDAQAKGGGRGAAPAAIENTNNPHGNWIDTRDAKNPVLLIADRGNRRIVRYTLDDKPIDIIEGTQQPCHFHEHKDLLVVPDLASRVSVIKGNKVVVTVGAPVADKPNPNRTTQNRAEFIPGQFVNPHGACFDQDGNIMVAEWVEIGRVTKLRRI